MTRRHACANRSRSRLDRGRRRDDSGISVVEVVIAVLVLIAVSLPVTFALISTEAGSNSLHMRAEATDLATQTLETQEYEMANGTVPTSGTQTSTVYSGSDQFSVTLSSQLVTGTGAGTLCTAASGATSSRIWAEKAIVSWSTGDSNPSVIETTLVSPTYADLADIDAAELAVPVYNAQESLETTTPIDISVQGACNGGCGTVPSGEVISSSANTGTTGCAVFPNLYAGTTSAPAVYTLTVTGTTPTATPGWVDDNELAPAAYAATASGPPTISNVDVTENEVTIPQQSFVMSQGDNTTVGFQTESFSGGTSTVKPAADIPVSMESSTLLCSGDNTCTMGNGSTAFTTATPEVALLFPGPATSPNYSLWAGDAADSVPGYMGYYGTAVATSASITAGATSSVILNVYPLTLALTIQSAAGTVSALSVTDASGGDTMALNYTTNATTSATGLPLGQFLLQATLTGTQSISVHYIWILPNGVCSSASYMSSPCTSPSTSSVAVTIS